MRSESRQPRPTQANLRWDLNRPPATPRFLLRRCDGTQPGVTRRGTAKANDRAQDTLLRSAFTVPWAM
jgi:hypothetical protein